MQTEAPPKEPFTLGILLRYKTTVIVVAALVIIGGYVRIITQPSLYEATARLAVRFPAEALALQEAGRGNFFRLPLLEEEVKAYMVQLMDPKFIDEVLRKLPPQDEAAATAEELAREPTAVEVFRDQFLKTYYEVRGAVLSALDTLLLTSDTMLSEREQEVMKVLSRLEVTAGTEASHIIVVTYRNRFASVAAQTANAVSLHFIDRQKRTVQPQNIAKFEKAAKDASEELINIQVGLYNLQNKIGSPTLEDAIKRKYTQIDALREEQGRLQIIFTLLKQNILAYDPEVPSGSYFVMGELERQFLDTLMKYEEGRLRVGDNPEFYNQLTKGAETILDRRREVVLERYRLTTEARLKFLGEEIQKYQSDRTNEEVVPEYTRLLTLQKISEDRVKQAEADLTAAKQFNEQLENETVSQNVRVWQPAQIPPFPMSQHRGLKLIVVMILGVLAGLAIALLRHQIRPKRVRRARPRHEEEVSMPIILLPDETKKESPRGSELNITFPPGEGTAPPGEGAAGRPKVGP